VLKHLAANRKRRLSALPSVSPYIYDVIISGFTRSSIYVYIYIYMTLVGEGLRKVSIARELEPTWIWGSSLIKCSLALMELSRE
jgi:hypothetical protein